MTATRIHCALACLFGAAGVVLMALGAHVAGSLSATAGQMLLIHAPAVLAATVARKAGFLADRLALLGIAALLLGPALFAGDLAMRELAGNRLFPMAAPVGGALAIAGWVLLTIAALTAPRNPVR
ncbi:MAG TPA: DUF423 domain-containing protein [Beijerinckiaceae bacterium]|nr:DUF423 domain-containing protein [Beijerinckiaceae bacterium]